MPFLITYWKQIAVALAIIMVYGAGYYKGYSNQKVKFDAFKLEVKLNAELQKKQNELLVKKQEAITNKVAKDYQDAIKKLHVYYRKHPIVKWVSNNTTSSGVSEVGSATSTVNGETESNTSSAAGVTPLDCASDVLQLLHLQKWINEQINAN